MPNLETERLHIRPLTPPDATAVFHLQQSIGWLNPAETEAEQKAHTQEYVRWSSLNHTQLARLYQPPYGDRAVVLKNSGQLIGLCGLVPYIEAMDVFPYFAGQRQNKTPSGRAFAEMGLFWAIHAEQQGQGYATEVARTLIHYAFTGLNLHHIIATTDYDNLASQRVMEKAGMHLQHNPLPEPPWLQVLGIIENQN
jgi:RimJ/RimL family protein N-acetyltransferase